MVNATMEMMNLNGMECIGVCIDGTDYESAKNLAVAMAQTQLEEMRRRHAIDKMNALLDLSRMFEDSMSDDELESDDDNDFWPF